MASIKMRQAHNGELPEGNEPPVQEHAKKGSASASMRRNQQRLCRLRVPAIYRVDGFSALFTAGLSLILLLVFFFKVFPQFGDAQTQLERGAKERLARHVDYQWALCPDVWKTSPNMTGKVQYNTGMPLLTLSCSPSAESDPAESLEAPIPIDGLELLGFLSFFFQPAGTQASKWCYTQNDLIDLYSRTTYDSVKSEVTGPGGCLRTDRNHTCIRSALNAIGDWDQPCTGLSRWGYVRRGPPMNNTAALADWVKLWTLRDILSFKSVPDGNSEENFNMSMVIRLQNWNDKKRYDYVVPLEPGKQYRNDPMLTKLQETVQGMKDVCSAASGCPEWSSLYSAFTDILAKNVSSGASANALHACLMSPLSTVQITESFKSAKSEFTCTKDVDQDQWTSWQVAFDVEKGSYKQQWQVGTVKVLLDYDVFFAYWAGLAGALLSAIFAAIAFFVYFLFAVFYEGMKLSRDEREREAGYNNMGELSDVDLEKCSPDISKPDPVKPGHPGVTEGRSEKLHAGAAVADPRRASSQAGLKRPSTWQMS